MHQRRSGTTFYGGELICAETYSAVGVEAICERAGVKKGSFCHFFASKADLAIQAMEEH